MKKILIVIYTFICTISCSNEKKYDINSNKYEKGKASIESIEKENPEQFLQVKGNSKKNLLKQTVITGNIFNSAKIVTFKDIGIKIQFYSKTGALLEEDQEVVYESIHPGGSVSFKSKYFAPKGADSVAMKVTEAKY